MHLAVLQADGIIIKRGTLGLDCLPEKMALVQKTLIKVGVTRGPDRQQGGPAASLGPISLLFPCSTGSSSDPYILLTYASSR